MICYAGLSNCCLAPAKLKEQFQKVHGDRKYWNTKLAEFKIKKARFGKNATLPVFGFALTNRSSQHRTKLRIWLQNRENYRPLMKNL